MIGAVPAVERVAEFAFRAMLLRGIVHEPSVASGLPPVLLFSGWGGTRYGPNAILVEAARALAEDGFPCARFDFRGRGESDGAVSEHDLASHIEDAAAIAEWVRAELGPQPPILLGICSGGEVAIGALFGGLDASAVCLWSAPIFAAEATEERRAAKRAGYVREYARKALRPETWRKLVAGQVRFDLVRKVLRGAGVHEKRADEPPQVAQGALFRADCGAALLVYGTADPVAEEARPFYEALFARSGTPTAIHLVEGANHGFYGLGWKAEVIAATRAWLRERFVPFAAS